MSLPSDETVRYDILIEARQAIEQLKVLGLQTQDNTTKIQTFSNLVLASSREWRVSWQQALAVYKLLNAELSKQKQGTIFGRTGGQDLFAESAKNIQALQASGRAVDDVTDKVKTLGNENKSAFERAITGVNGFRIALGAVISMLLFQGIQAVTQFFQTAIQNAQELEASLYRIHNAERILSGEGIEVTTKGLEDGIKRIKKLLPIFSKEDIAGLVGQLAISTKSLGLNEKQIIDLAQSIAVMNVNSAEEENLMQTGQKVISSLLTSNAKGVAGLGLKLGDAAIKAEAIKEGFLEAGESLKNLTDQEKSIVKVNLAIQTGADSIAGLNEFLDSNTGRIQANKAAWNDLLTTIGQAILPFVPAATAGFSALTDAVNYFKTALATVGTVLTTVLTVLRMLLGGNIKSFGDLRQAIHDVGEEAKKLVFRQLFPEGIPDNAPNWFKKLVGNSLAPSETPTGTSTPDTSGTDETEAKAAEDRNKKIQKAEEDLQKILQDSADKKADIERDYQRKLQDIATNYSQKLEDIARNTAEKKEDASRNYAQKVEDINRDAGEKIAQAQQDARQREIDREKEYQQRLKELRDKFLFDLEDALRERDARQVLRLMRQYNMDKANLEAKHKLDEQQGKKDLQQKIADIERDRQLKLEAAKREYDDKLKEIAIGEARARDEARIWQQRQLQDARIWHQRQLAEQREYLQRKLRDLAAALAQELKMTQQGAQAIASTLSSVFGSALNGLIPVAGSGAITGGSLGNGSNWGQLANTWNSLLSTWQNSGMYGTQGLADGGTMLATRPTTLNVGEKTPELVTAIPLNKMGQASSFLPNGMTQSQGGGSLALRITLSDGLIADIVDTSLDNVATQIEKITRSK